VGILWAIAGAPLVGGALFFAKRLMAGANTLVLAQIEDGEKVWC